MKKEHLYRGEWISEQELESKLGQLEGHLAQDLSKKLSPSLLLKTAGILRERLLKKRQTEELIESLMQTGSNKQQAEQTLAIIADFLNPESLKEKYNRELGSLDPFQLKRIHFKSDVFEAWAPLGVLVHVVPGNAATVAPLSVLEGLMTGNINLLKNSSKNGNFPQLILKELVDTDETGLLKIFVYAFQISSKQTSYLEKIFAEANGIAAWGGEESVAAVKNMAAPSVRIIDWGHKISFGYISKSQSSNQEALQALAYDICVIEQQACSSPQCLYLETNDKKELEEFASNFAKVLAQVSATFKQKPPSIVEAAEISNITLVQKTAQALGESLVIEAPDHTWRVLVDYQSGLRPSPLFRSIWIKPLALSEIVSVLEPLRTYLQTAALACSKSELPHFSASLFSAGVTRIMPPGKMLDGYAGQPHDGVYALQRYARRTSLISSELTQGISDFMEFQPQELPTHLAQEKINTKDDFLNQKIADEDAELFFKSGGTTGQPKKAVYTYEDYHIQMKAGAEALFAAGLNPKTDRCANLFYSGNMYGGFISFWSILEYLQAKQFPITAINDFDELCHHIISNKIDTLLGMPFYLSQFFEHSHEKLAEYGGLKKVFYGGEHWDKKQWGKYAQSFGIQMVKSAIYGSNDAGPLAYACSHTQGSIHHVLTQTQYLEILKLHSDEAVEGDEVGRLIFSSKYRKGQQLNRYEIGDLGRWVEGDCACGRKAPRFELLGRFGDIFKMGPLFNYNEFLKILQDSFNYTGALQLVLDDQISGPQSITLCIENSCPHSEAEIISSLLLSIPIIKDLNEKELLIALKVAFIDKEDFKKVKTTAKLIPIIDRRDNK